MTSNIFSRELQREAFSALGQKLRIGWRVIGKAFLASIVISLWNLPLIVIEPFTSHAEFFQRDTLSSVSVRLGLAAFFILVYLPLAFYSAASWVGFCETVYRPVRRPSNDVKRAV